jgi:FkbM family methyltransferase
MNEIVFQYYLILLYLMLYCHGVFCLVSYAFEPQAHLAHLLAASVALNTGGNVGIFAESLELSQQIVSNTGGVSVSAPVMSYGEDEKLHNYAEQSFLHYLTADDPLPGEITSIITTTIDDIWFESRNDDDNSGPSSRYIEENLSLKCPSVLKIDVERMEYLVLRGSKHLIKQCLPLLNVESWHELSKETLIEMCTSLGYSSIWDHSFTVTLFSPFSDKNHILVNPTRNTICIPPARALSYEIHRRLHDLIDKEVRRGRMIQLYGT